MADRGWGARQGRDQAAAEGGAAGGNGTSGQVVGHPPREIDHHVDRRTEPGQVELVVTSAPVDGLVAVAGPERVVTRAALEGFGQAEVVGGGAVAQEQVVAGAPHHGDGARGDVAVEKGEPLPVRQRVGANIRARDGCAGEGLDVGGEEEQDRLDREGGGAEVDRHAVNRRAVIQRIAQDLVEFVVAGAASQVVVAGSARQRVAAAAGVQGIVAPAAREAVGDRIARDRVAAAAARDVLDGAQDVVAVLDRVGRTVLIRRGIAQHDRDAAPGVAVVRRVGAGPAVQQVVARAAPEQVVAPGTVKRVVAGAAEDRVVQDVSGDEVVARQRVQEGLPVAKRQGVVERCRDRVPVVLERVGRRKSLVRHVHVVGAERDVPVVDGDRLVDQRAEVDTGLHVGDLHVEFQRGRQFADDELDLFPQRQDVREGEVAPERVGGLHGGGAVATGRREGERAAQQARLRRAHHLPARVLVREGRGGRDRHQVGVEFHVLLERAGERQVGGQGRVAVVVAERAEAAAVRSLKNLARDPERRGDQRRHVGARFREREAPPGVGRKHREASGLEARRGRCARHGRQGSADLADAVAETPVETRMATVQVDESLQRAVAVRAQVDGGQRHAGVDVGQDRDRDVDADAGL